MAFKGYLTNREIGELAHAALSGGLLGVPRQVLLAGIPAAFVAAMPTTDNLLDQFQLDLVDVNRVERMVGGEIPVQILLRNAADRLRLLDRQEAEVFDLVLSRAERAVAGVPPPANPTQPPRVTRNDQIARTDDTPGTTPADPGKTKWRIGSWDVTIRAALIGGAFAIIAAIIVGLIPYLLGAYSGTPQPSLSPAGGPRGHGPSSTAIGRWGTAEQVPGTAALNRGVYAGTDSVSCAAAGSCAAGGHFTDRSGHSQAFVVTEQGTAEQVPGTAALNRGGDARTDSVSCAAAGSCAAGGDYAVRSGVWQAFVVTEQGGQWGTAIEVPGTATLNSGKAETDSVSCAAAGSCAAGGYYPDHGNRFDAFIVRTS